MSIIENIQNLPDFALPIENFAKAHLEAGNYSANEEFALISNKKSVAPQYYQMVFWAGVTDETIDLYAEKFDLQFPEQYRQILKSFNGINVVGLSIFGIPKSMLSDPPLLNSKTRQCLDIRAANVHWIHDYKLEPNLFHFGSRHYSNEENCGYFISTEGTIYSFLKNGESVGAWDNLEDFFHSEISATIEFGDD